MSFSFKNTQEEVKTVGTKVSVGIHDLKVKEIKVETIAGKDGNPDWEKGVVIFECTKTIEGRDSVGKTIDYSILYPKDEESAEKLGKRLLHIFSKVTTKDKVENAKKAIQALDLSSIKTLIDGLKKIADGKSIRMKVVGDKNKQYPMIPLYYSGYAETIDTNPTELKFDSATEGLVKKDESKVESTTEDKADDFPF